tara:strand:- start:469 stop:747 length:279 start_codon:yes stop_codon:yes gene_type:complete
MKTELDICINILLEMGYRYMNFGNDLDNPLKLRMKVDSTSILPDTVWVTYNEEDGNVDKLTYYKMDGYLDFSEIESKIKTELRNNNINDVLK